MMLTERRLRAAADYWYRGTEKGKDYAAFSAPASRGSGPGSEPGGGEPGDPSGGSTG